MLTEWKWFTLRNFLNKTKDICIIIKVTIIINECETRKMKFKWSESKYVKFVEVLLSVTRNTSWKPDGCVIFYLSWLHFFYIFQYIQLYYVSSTTTFLTNIKLLWPHSNKSLRKLNRDGYCRIIWMIEVYRI